MKKLRAGLAGYGKWTRSAYLPALLDDGRSRVVAAAAPSQATRKRIRAELGSEIEVYQDFESLLIGAGIDFVLLGLPNARHEAALAKAMEAGVPFLYEPPVSDRLERIPSLLRALLSCPTLNHADLELRYAPLIGRASRRIADGAIGDPLVAHIRMNGTWNPRPNAHISLPHALASWYVDALNCVLGKQPRRVLVQDGRGTSGRMQAYALTQLDYGEVWGTFSANISAVDGPETQIEVQGRSGDLVVDLFSEELKLRNRADLRWRVERVPARKPWAGWPGMHECLRSFLDAVQGQGHCLDAITMARLHLVGLAAERSIDTGTWAAVQQLEELKEPTAAPEDEFSLGHRSR